MLLPAVVGFRLTGALPAGSTATDLVLTITELLRGHGVVGKFVEFHGEGVGRISVPDRATIANMSPEFGSTCSYFPIDDETLRYLRLTGRPASAGRAGRGVREGAGPVARTGPAIRRLHRGSRTGPGHGASVTGGPRRPQDRVPLDLRAAMFRAALAEPAIAAPAAALPASVLFPANCSRYLPRHTYPERAPLARMPRPPRSRSPARSTTIAPGAVAIAAITSCTNTSNPTVMVTAGLLARNAVQRGLASKPG